MSCVYQSPARQTAGRWGKYLTYTCKIGTHSTTIALIRTVRRFRINQHIKFCELRDVQGMCLGMAPKWQHGLITRITPTHLFIDR